VADRNLAQRMNVMRTLLWNENGEIKLKSIQDDDRAVGRTGLRRALSRLNFFETCTCCKRLQQSFCENQRP